MGSMIRSEYDSIIAAQSEVEYRSALVRFTENLGFTTVGAFTAIDHPMAPTEFHGIENVPISYKAHHSDASQGRIDPVMQHCKWRSTPIVWDERTYRDCNQGDMWEMLASHGMRSGISLALHMPEGRHFMIGVERDCSVPKDMREQTRMVADLQLFAVYAQDIATRILLPSTKLADMPKLTPRELEALRWTMDGKTAWEVGMILGISERTAVLHLSNAMHKLSAVNKHQAVLKALRAGLL